MSRNAGWPLLVANGGTFESGGVKMPIAQEEPLPVASSHPEEIKSVFDLRLGKHVTLQGSARITPAGVIGVGIAVALMTLALGYLASSTRRRR